jgi:NAD(P)-dependent dehydrogenase (short-subunit alcohol dehydrogenase family)
VSQARGNIVITGASTGIGRASALRLDREGFDVFAGVRREADGDSLRAEASQSLRPLLLDVTDSGSIDAAADEVRAAGEGRLTGLVNNAGVAVAGPLEFLAIDDFRRSLEVNLTGQLAVTQAFLPLLRAGRGRIVFISSIGGRLATPFMGPYHASKFGLEAVADSLRQELRPHAVMVSVVEPGATATPIWEKGSNAAVAARQELGPEAESLYGASLDRMEDVARETGERGVPPDQVAATILKALTARRPRTRYQVGIDSKVGVRLRALLPDRVMDRAIARNTGL